jgi:23S rRNA pseudouridine2457 synthase
MVSQFRSPDAVRLLGALDFEFPEGIHAVGRLDNKSEGLLLLTTNKKVQRLLYLTTGPHQRTYVVLVKNNISEESLQQLRNGVPIKVAEGNYITAPAKVERIERPDYIPAGEPEYIAEIPHSWLQISLTEGKYHQVRKMLAAVRHPVRRLIRVSIEDLELKGMIPGEVKEIAEEEFFEKLRIEYPAGKG